MCAPIPPFSTKNVADPHETFLGCQQTVADGFRRVQFFAVRRGGKKFP